MIAYHRKHPTGGEYVSVGRQGRRKLLELLVQGDSHGLKHAGEHPRSSTRTEHFANRVHQVVTHPERFPDPATRYRAGQGGSPPFVSVVPEGLGELRDVDGIEVIRSRPTARVHPHVQGDIAAEREPAGVIVELVRGDTQVEQDEVRPESLDGRDDVGLSKGANVRLDLREPFAHAGDRPRIPIEGQHIDAARREAARMTSPTHREVGGAAGILGEAENFFCQHRLMITSHGAPMQSGPGGSPPGPVIHSWFGRQAGLTGLEPAASGVTDRHSNQLSYSPR